MKSTLFTFVLLLLLFSCSNSQDKLIRKWKATEINLAGNLLKGEMIEGVYITFKEDGTYESNILGEDEGDSKGSWKMGDNSIARKATNGKEWNFKVLSLTSNELIISYEDHGMKRQFSFNSSK